MIKSRGKQLFFIYIVLIYYLITKRNVHYDGHKQQNPQKSNS